MTYAPVRLDATSSSSIIFKQKDQSATYIDMHE